MRKSALYALIKFFNVALCFMHLQNYLLDGVLVSLLVLNPLNPFVKSNSRFLRNALKLLSGAPKYIL